MENYFNYFTEIEEHFRRRRGGAMLLSTLDWALIETWKDAGLPLAAVLRGIDVVFDHYDKRKVKTQKINSLAFCTQAVLNAAEDMKEAAVGAAAPAETSAENNAKSGFSPAEIDAFLTRSAAALDAAKAPDQAVGVLREAASFLRNLAGDLAGRKEAPLEDLERNLTAFEEKICAALLSAMPHEELVVAQADVDREIAPYRRKMQAAQIQQLHRQYIQRRLFERARIPRLSLFYM